MTVRRGRGNPAAVRRTASPTAAAGRATHSRYSASNSATRRFRSFMTAAHSSSAPQPASVSS